MGSFLFARSRRWMPAALLGALAALTRAVGVLMFLPLIYLWWTQADSRRWRDGLSLLMVPLATLSFLALTGLSGVSSLQNGWRAKFVLPWQNIVEFCKLAGQNRLLPIDIFDLFVVVVFAILCYAIWTRLPREFGLYSLAMFLVPLFRVNAGQPFVSMARYVLVIFPAFILLGQWGKNPWVNRLILYLSFPVLLYFSAQFWMWGWVG